MSENTTSAASMVAFFENAGLKRPSDDQVDELFAAMQYVGKMRERVRPHGTHVVEPALTFDAAAFRTPGVAQ